MNKLETAQNVYADANGAYHAEWARGDSPALVAAEAQREVALTALCEENRRATLIEAVRDHALRYYEQGWDVLIECYDDEDILDMIQDATTSKAAIQAVADQLGIQARPLSGFIVMNRDVDGISGRAYQSFRLAAERYQEMSGRELPIDAEQAIRAGRSVQAISDYGNVVTLSFR
jgi:hypothetical protein